MLPNDYTQQWVMNPDSIGHITNVEIYEVLVCLKTHVDECQKSKESMYKAIADILNKKGLINDDKLEKLK